MTQTPILDATGATANIENPLAPGRAAATASKPIALSTEDFAAIGATNETAPTTSTATSGLNGRLQYLAKQLEANPAANGLTSSRVKSAASTNATSIKGSAGRIAQIDLFNNSAAIKFFKLYNKASAPTVGTDVPIWTIPIPANSGFSSNFRFGKYFATGIAYAITGLIADSDTTAVAADDVHGSIDWI